MKLQLLRNATLRLTYAGQHILVDPCLGAKGSLPSFAGLAPNPTVELPIATASVIEGVDVTVISHLHADHFDPAAASLLPRSMSILCQPANLAELREQGFTDVKALTEELNVHGITVTPTPGQHGTGSILERMGSVIGFTLQSPHEPTLFWAGDTILTEEVLQLVDEVKPDVIVTHSGGATLANTLLIMDVEQTLQLCHHAKNATVVAVHLEALDHCTVSRTDLRTNAERQGLTPERLLIPADGETIEFSKG